ncbi:hypothetical protein BIV60_13720 [Bacillus sp. MUM 116]|uniref:gamma-glutamylcyclotransferase family protein n=1 Tax=Bacillus sp. MUM 116 TaxID=1678002 RepID=UPI0008F564EF|nr:gamma-glutamylcyclotransferase family protein [Bacillus sp. MUM 116]OIK13655.1 hypothetical protein BIV60_13720 [Bacillus sp. MUM 116]
MENRHLVFVYGTLRKQERNHKLLKNAVCVENGCWTEGKLFDSHHGYPFLVQSTEGKVVGELYLVDDANLSDLDRLEEYHGVGKNNLYDRVEQLIQTDNGNYQAVVYVLPDKSNSKNMQLIENGDWCQYRVLKQRAKNIKPNKMA